MGFPQDEYTLLLWLRIEEYSHQTMALFSLKNTQARRSPPLFVVLFPPFLLSIFISTSLDVFIFSVPFSVSFVLSFFPTLFLFVSLLHA